MSELECESFERAEVKGVLWAEASGRKTGGGQKRANVRASEQASKGMWGGWGCGRSVRAEVKRWGGGGGISV